jgi:hypothetical protein
MLTPALILSDNGKVKFRPNHRNTFGLNFGLPKDGGTCVGATKGAGGCLDVRTGKKRETCYMAKITQIYKAVATVLQKNSDQVVGKSYDQMVTVLTNTFQNFVDANEREHWFFRINYSGDIFSEDFARALVASCNKFPAVKFWIYTRSFDFAHILVQAKNLAVYLSIDPINMDKGYKVFNSLKPSYNNIGMAHLGAAPNVIQEKFVGCPETYGKISNTKDRGACAACKLCFTYNDRIRLRNISFKIH